MVESLNVQTGERVVIADFDGVIRVGEVFCPERIERLRKCCEILEAKLVVSSDWRNFGLRDNLDEDSGDATVHQDRAHVEGHLGKLAGFLHDDWATPVSGTRWLEVQAWLELHPEVTQYAILEDQEAHFWGCPGEMAERIVWCNNRHGFVAELSGRLCRLFAPKGDHISEMANGRS